MIFPLFSEFMHRDPVAIQTPSFSELQTGTKLFYFYFPNLCIGTPVAIQTPTFSELQIGTKLFSFIFPNLCIGTPVAIQTL